MLWAENKGIKRLEMNKGQRGAKGSCPGKKHCMECKGAPFYSLALIIHRVETLNAAIDHNINLDQEMKVRRPCSNTHHAL